SVSKLLTALAVLIAVEEGTVALDADVASLVDRPDLAPLRLDDLLSHSSGLAPEAPLRRLAPQEQRRIYSNAGYELAAELGARRGDPRPQIAALDRTAQLTRDLRALRAHWDAALVGPGRRTRPDRAERPRLRRMGRGRMACPRRCRGTRVVRTT